MHRIILTAAGAVAGATIAHAHHRRRRAERLAAATFETLLNAIDANDELTGAHVRRVAAYSLVLASAIGLDTHQSREVERVALFHDIGKLDAALFDIVHEADKLTAAERRAIATHPRRGADVLQPLATFYPALAAGVLAHHERWDGKGYPSKLRGQAIPLAARIVAIADTFDAITASRRYRRGENVTKALDIIADGRGKQFDPALTDAFLEPWVIDEITATMQEAHDRARRPNRRRAVPQPPVEAEAKTPATVPDVRFRWRDRLVRPQVASRPTT